MIDKGLEVIKGTLENYLKLLPELNLTSGDFIVLSHVVKPNGTLAVQDNSLAITLVNVEEERILKSQNTVSILPNGNVSKVNPEIKLNLFILVSANYQNYNTALQYLSAVVRCFQANNVFTKEKVPGMDPSIEKLLVELYTLNFEQQNHLWGALGAKYMPSVLYRVRLITIQEAIQSAEQKPIKKIHISDKEL
ncbi:MAG: DUF4255 domain-containing protein [Bacteroidetes bacterium]|nr:DUF4255 domain-containing protein [Bacteroidota bacterium]